MKVGVAIDNDVKVYVNGRVVGSDHHEGCARRDSSIYPVPDNFLNNGSNLITAIASDDSRGGSYLDLQVTAEVADNSYSQSCETVTSKKGTDEAFGRRSGARITKSGLRPGENDWTEWRPTAWRSLDFRLSCNVEDEYGKTKWYVEFRNRYQETINFDFGLTEPGVAASDPFAGRTHLKPQKTDWSWYLLKTTCSSIVTVWVGKVIFGDNEDYSSPYAKPDNP